MDAHDLVGRFAVVAGDHETEALVKEAQVGPDFPSIGFLGLEVCVRKPVRHAEHRLAGPRRRGHHNPFELVGVRIVPHPRPACPQLPGTEQAASEVEGFAEKEGAGDRGVEVGVIALWERGRPVVAAGQVQRQPALVAQGQGPVEATNLPL